ncbi:MAG: ornithine cyclodeaminase family protein [Acidimicrobiia bacterium]
MRYLSAADVPGALSMAHAIAAMEQAFGDDIEAPQRVTIGPSMFMPGRVGDISGIKVVSTVPGNPVGIVAVFGPDGRCLGLVDGPTLTAIRTAAAAGLATRLLARPDARAMAMLGAGAMAFDQVRAVQEVRPIAEVLVWSRTPERAEALADRVDGEAVKDAAEAVAKVDVVTTATPARDPLFPASSVRPGTHLNAIGAFTPEMAEVPEETVRAARVFVDQRQAAAAEAGDLIRADRSPDATLGDLLAGRVAGRQTHSEVTLFKSVGIASQDVSGAAAALRGAEELNIGTVLD